MILAGDVGGTKANLALFESEGSGRISLPRNPETYRCADFPSFEALIEEYRRRHPGPVEIASFGVAGPVIREHVKGTHLPWEIDAVGASRRLGIRAVLLLNDLAATGHGISALTADELIPIQAGEPDPESCAGLIAAGTGLGETLLVPTATSRVPIPSEGGHADFAPRTDREIELFRELRARFGRVSYERVVSGLGILNVARWTHAAEKARTAWRNHEAEDSTENSDLPAAITSRALDRSCPWCREALDIFISAYGAEAGNLALRGLARGGIYLGGGIAPKLVPALLEGTFLEAFRDKEPHADLLATIPIWVIRDDRTAVLGAARFATLTAAA
jgi:glucokinase